MVLFNVEMKTIIVRLSRIRCSIQNYDHLHVVSAGFVGPALVKVAHFLGRKNDSGSVSDFICIEFGINKMGNFFGKIFGNGCYIVEFGQCRG